MMGRNLKERDHLDDLDTDAKNTYQCDLKNYIVRNFGLF
jgi:hypothetical protein